MDNESNIQRIKDIQDISIAIDSWDDIFSDFDPSPLTQRVLSGDFLSELKKRYRENARGEFIITIYAPIELEDKGSERIVIKRLKQYFKFRQLSLLKDIRLLRIKGLMLLFFGMLSLGVITFLTYYKTFKQLTIELMGIILMPLGWFGIWEGFSLLIEQDPFIKKDIDLFTKLSRAAFTFKYVKE
ncbi:MAG: hypothetical protein ABH857_04000 [Elusimicrobiota bacterium]